MINLRHYNNKDYAHLLEMLDLYRLEQTGNYGDVKLDEFISSHNYIYMVIKDGVIIGFAAYVITDNFGMTEKMLVNTYVYIFPNHRKSKAFYAIMMKSGELVLEHNVPFTFFTENEELIKMASKFKATPMYQMYRYSIDDCATAYYRLSEIFNKEK